MGLSQPELEKIASAVTGQLLACGGIKAAAMFIQVRLLMTGGENKRLYHPLRWMPMSFALMARWMVTDEHTALRIQLPQGREVPP